MVWSLCSYDQAWLLGIHRSEWTTLRKGKKEAYKHQSMHGTLRQLWAASVDWAKATQIKKGGRKQEPTPPDKCISMETTHLDVSHYKHSRANDCIIAGLCLHVILELSVGLVNELHWDVWRRPLLGVGHYTVKSVSENQHQAWSSNTMCQGCYAANDNQELVCGISKTKLQTKTKNKQINNEAKMCAEGIN